MSDPLGGVAWTRFWVPRETPPVIDGDGYLVDPLGKYGKQLNPHAKALEELDELPCVALLGEPGIGKSHVVQDYYQAAKAKAGGNAVLYVDFRWARDLDKALFQADAFRRWRAEQAPFLLILDSLDECRDGAVEVASKLGDAPDPVELVK
jgi:hypothetical protein